MKIAVVGAGAVGGLLAARLSEAGHAVSVLARGATLAALQGSGLRLREGGAERRVAVQASDHPASLGQHELVIVAVKAPALAAAAPAIAALAGPSGTVMPAMNGVPWWFLAAAPEATRAAGTARLASIDAQGRIADALPLAQVIGCVVHLSCSSPAPGVVVHAAGQRLIIGEPAGGLSDRVQALGAALTVPGLTAEPSADIRRDIWFKLWGNMTLNPVSALTGATCDQMLDDPLVSGFVLRAMAEAAEVGARIGCPIGDSGESRLALTRQLGAFKTSMLQDAEAGRPLELDALVSAVHEIGERVGVAMPNIGALLGLARLMARGRGLYPGTGASPDRA